MTDSQPYLILDCYLDEVAPDRPRLEVFARTRLCAVHGFGVRGRPMWALQFHPEMPPEESERVLRSSLQRHPRLGEDPEFLLRAAVDARPRGTQLLANFRHLAKSARRAPLTGTGSTFRASGAIPPDSPLPGPD